MVTTQPVEPSIWQNYAIKAREFFDMMEDAKRDKKWNGASLMAVHCVISFSDALLAKCGGIRNTSQDHQSAGDLLKRYVRDADIQTQVTRFNRIITKKNLAAYEGRTFSENDGSDLVLQAERFVSWAERILRDE